MMSSRHRRSQITSGYRFARAQTPFHARGNTALVHESGKHARTSTHRREGAWHRSFVRAGYRAGRAQAGKSQLHGRHWRRCCRHRRGPGALCRAQQRRWRHVRRDGPAGRAIMCAHSEVAGWELCRAQKLTAKEHLPKKELIMPRMSSLPRACGFS